MNYTIVTTTDVHNDQLVSLVKDGDKYMVTFKSSGEQIVYRSRKFDTLEAAESKYLYLVRCIIRGEYAVDDRIRILET